MSCAPRTRRAVALAALLCLPLAAPCFAGEDGGNSGIAIENAWARATPRGAEVAGAYLTITNRGTAPDTLTGGSADVAAHFELHDMTMSDGVMRMRPSGPLTIPPGGTLALTPHGRHIMLSGLKYGLSKGESFEGALTFARAGTVPVRFSVEGIGAMAPAGAAASGDAMPEMAGHGHAPPGGQAKSGTTMPGMKMD